MDNGLHQKSELYIQTLVLSPNSIIYFTSMFTKLFRNTLNEIYFGKTRDIVNGLLIWVLHL